MRATDSKNDIANATTGERIGKVEFKRVERIASRNVVEYRRFIATISVLNFENFEK